MVKMPSRRVGKLYLNYDGINLASFVTDDSVRAVIDSVRFFDALVIMAQERKDARTFMAGSSFIKFCGIALIFAQRVSYPFTSVLSEVLDRIKGRRRVERKAYHAIYTG
jgi:hypothetical protein